MLDVIIVTWNSAEDVRRCLGSIESNYRERLLRESPCLNVWVVDGGSSDRTVEVVSEFRWAQLIRLVGNPGFAICSNAGFRAGCAGYALFLNPDTEVCSQSLEGMLAPLTSDPRIGAVGPYLLNTDGSLQKMPKTLPTVWELFHDIPAFRWLRPDNYRELVCLSNLPDQGSIETEWVLGAALLARRSDVEAIGLFDEQFFLFSEDIDFCHRIRKLGKKVVCTSASKIVHHGGRSTSAYPTIRHTVLWGSHFYYIRKHHGVLASLSLRVLVFVGYAFEYLVELYRFAFARTKARPGYLKVSRAAMLTALGLRR